MFSILFVEGLKWKRPKMLWVIAAAILLPGLLTLGLVWGTFNHGRETVWESLFTNHFGVFNLLFAPAVFMLLMGFLFAREHQEHTINALFNLSSAPLEVVFWENDDDVSLCFVHLSR